MAYASCASAWFTTVPVRMMPSPMLSTLTLEVGMCCLIALVMMSTERFDRDLEASHLPPLGIKKAMLVAPSWLPLI